MDQPVPDTLPPSLHRFFWDTDPSRVNPREKPCYVINRLLDKGDLEAARWVLRTYPRETIRETLIKIKDFSPWNGVFWSRYLDLPREEVACLDPSYRKMRAAVWPY